MSTQGFRYGDTSPAAARQFTDAITPAAFQPNPWAVKWVPPKTDGGTFTPGFFGYQSGVDSSGKPVWSQASEKVINAANAKGVNYSTMEAERRNKEAENKWKNGQLNGVNRAISDVTGPRAAEQFGVTIDGQRAVTEQVRGTTGNAAAITGAQVRQIDSGINLDRNYFDLEHLLRTNKQSLEAYDSVATQLYNQHGLALRGYELGNQARIAQYEGELAKAGAESTMAQLGVSHLGTMINLLQNASANFI